MFAESWRRGRAISAAIMLIPFLIFLSYSMTKAKDKIVSEQTVQAIIKNVEFRGKKEYRHFKTQVTLPDGEEITLLIAPSPAPKRGEALPVKVFVRESGEKEYKLDRESWGTQK